MVLDELLVTVQNRLLQKPIAGRILSHFSRWSSDGCFLTRPRANASRYLIVVRIRTSKRARRGPEHSRHDRLFHPGYIDVANVATHHFHVTSPLSSSRVCLSSSILHKTTLTTHCE